MFSKREIQLFIHEALSIINGVVGLYCGMAGMHFTFNPDYNMPTGILAVICYGAAAYAFRTYSKYAKSARALERKIKSEKAA